MDVKVGDVVHVRGYVLALRCDSGESLIAYRDETNNRLDLAYRAVVSNDRIVHVEPRPLKVGDFVKCKGCVNGGIKIVAVAGSDAWVEWPEGDHETVPLCELERV